MIWLELYCMLMHIIAYHDCEGNTHGFAELLLLESIWNGGWTTY